MSKTEELETTAGLEVMESPMTIQKLMVKYQENQPERLEDLKGWSARKLGVRTVAQTSQ